MRFAAATLAFVLTVSACASSGNGIPADIVRQPDHPEWSRRSPDLYVAQFETSKGKFAIEVHRDWSPLGADRFYNLVRLGYYDDTRFHRVLPNYIVQWGLHGDPEINRIWKTRYYPADSLVQSNTRGTIGFAHTSPELRSTQVYINLADNSRNDRDTLTPFGRVIEGMEVVDSIYGGYGARSGGGLRQGTQGPVEQGGNAYLQREFPLLDYTIRAYIRRS